MSNSMYDQIAYVVSNYFEGDLEEFGNHLEIHKKTLQSQIQVLPTNAGFAYTNYELTRNYILSLKEQLEELREEPINTYTDDSILRYSQRTELVCLLKFYSIFDLNATTIEARKATLQNLWEAEIAAINVVLSRLNKLDEPELKDAWF